MIEPIYAFFDECGEESFGPAASEWFILSASIQRAEKFDTVRDCFDKFRAAHFQPNWHFHFTKAGHLARLAFIEAMKPASYRFMSVIIHKASIKKTENFQRPYFLYFYAAKLLIERISWDAMERNEMLDGLYLSSRRGLKVDKAREYLEKLRDGYFSEMSNKIDWQAVSLDHIMVEPNKSKVGLQLADCMASSIGNAICPEPYGLTEDRYLLALKEHIYSHKGSRLSYGLKFFPSLPHPLNKEGRFSWLDEMRR